MIWQSFLREKESKTGKLPALTTVKDKKSKNLIFFYKNFVFYNFYEYICNLE